MGLNYFPGRQTKELSYTAINGRVDGLDHLRGVAILMVFGFHCLFAVFGYDQPGWQGWWRSFDLPNTYLALYPLSFGWGGVAAFFAISGFCIHLSFARSKPHGIRSYAIRRFFRIYPPYLIALLLFALVFPPTKLGFGSTEDFVQLLSRLFLVHNLNPSTFWGINGVFWSVAVEVQLYAVYPLVLLFGVNKLGWGKTIALAFCLEMFLRTFTTLFQFGMIDTQLSYVLTQGPFAYLFSWLIGARLASDYLAGRPLFLSDVPIKIWLILLVIALFFKPLYVFSFPLFSLCTASWIARSLNKGKYLLPLPRVLNRHLEFVGLISYSVYLLHQPLLNFAPQLLQAAFPGEFIHPIFKLSACLVMYPVVLMVSWVFYRLIEVPSIGAGKALIKMKINSTSEINSDVAHRRT